MVVTLDDSEALVLVVDVVRLSTRVAIELLLFATVVFSVEIEELNEADEL